MFQSGFIAFRNRISAPGRSGNSKRYSSSLRASADRPPTMWRKWVLAISSWVRSSVSKPWRRKFAAILSGSVADDTWMPTKTWARSASEIR
ncbi:hypothetical protein D3C72_2267050 [compost metagenome]